MRVVDFSRSFIYWTVDMAQHKPTSVTHEPPFSLNVARVQIASLCVVESKASGETEMFVLGESCKTERVGVQKDIWTQPNADFHPLCTRTMFRSIKAFERIGRNAPLWINGEVQPDDHIVPASEAFAELSIVVHRDEGIHLQTVDQVIEATLAHERLMFRTIFENERYRATVDYPAKVLNVSSRDRYFQSDTGPMLIPDLGLERDELLAGFDLAYSAFSNEHWAEFIVRTRTPVAEGVSVYHYSCPVRAENIRNSVYKLSV